MPRPTLADVMAFEALPLETQAIAKRVLGQVLPGATQRELEEAYTRGRKDGAREERSKAADRRG